MPGLSDRLEVGVKGPFVNGDYTREYDDELPEPLPQILDSLLPETDLLRPLALRDQPLLVRTHHLLGMLDHEIHLVGQFEMEEDQFVFRWDRTISGSVSYEFGFFLRGNAADVKEVLRLMVTGVAFIHSPDFRWISYEGKEFFLNSRQAEFFQLLYGKHRNGVRWVSKEYLLTEIDAGPSIRKPSILFKRRNKKAYDLLIEHNDRGGYRLIPCSSEEFFKSL
jgi:hypothetical protein